MPASTHFTIGIEEEFQIVDRHTGQLSPQVYTILRKGASTFGEKIKPEMLQSTIELITDVCPDISATRLELLRLHAALLQLVGQEFCVIAPQHQQPLRQFFRRFA